MTHHTQQGPDDDSQDGERVRGWLGKMRSRLWERSCQPLGLGSPAASRSLLRLAASDPDEVARLLQLPHGLRLLPDDRPTEIGGSPLPSLATLHSRADLQAILQHLAWKTTANWEERGIQTLFLVYGLLEWKGTGGLGGEGRRPAPLWLHPVGLRREGGSGSLDGQWRLHGRGRGELNPTVLEILRERDGLDLTGWSPAMPLSTSINWIEGRVGAGNWQVSPEWILTHLSPDGYSMWADLDPRIWPQDRLLRHPLIRRFALGQPLAAPEPVGESQRRGEAVDALELEGQLPRLIEIADSTQHLALREVLRGRSLVIEAPPGTGKSRTIANLIAAAMGAGKTILVIASKVATLDRLRGRLSEAGLGDFCLHLGDGRGQGEGLPGEGIVSTGADLSLRLRERLPQRGTWQMPADLPTTRVERGRLLRQRIDYRATMAQPCGASGLTIAQVIGEREWLLQEASFPLAVVEAIQLPNVEALDSDAIGEREQAAHLYAQCLASLTERYQPGGHPWRGVGVERLSLADERELRDLLETIASVALRIETEIDLFRLAHRVVFDANEEQLQQLLALDGQIPTVSPRVDRALLPRLVDRSNRAILARLLAHCRAVEEWEATPCELPRLALAAVEQGLEACRRAKRIDLDHGTIGELRRSTAWARRLAEDLSQTGRFFEECAHHFDLPFAFDLATARLLVRAVALCAEAPLGAIHLRHPRLEEATLGPILLRARREAEEIIALGRELDQRLDLTLAPPLDQVRRHVRTCREVDILGLASTRYRQARHDWRVMTRQSRRPTRQRLARDYGQLLHYHHRRFEFGENPLYRRALGELFRGVETPLEEVQSLVDWSERVSTLLEMGGETAARMATVILRLPAADLRALHRRGTAGLEQGQLLVRIAAALPSLPPALQQESTADLTYLTQQVRELAEEAQGILDDLEEAGLGEVEGSITALEGKLQSLRELREWEEMIEEDRAALGLTGEPGRPTRADRQRWEATADFLAEVTEEGPLPASLLGWLLTPAIDQRLVALRNLISTLRLDYPLLEEAMGRLARLVQLHEGQWFGLGEGTGRRSGLRQIRKRAEQALAAWEQLPLWLRLRRARKGLLDLGLAPLVARVERGEIASRDIVKAIRAIYYGSLLREAYRRHPSLDRFDGQEQEEERRRLVDLDERVERLTREEIAWQVDRLPVPPGVRLGPLEERTELGFLEALAAREVPTVPIRSAWERAGTALSALMPCLLMSPAHVASHLPAHLDPFDLVILDDASRLRTEEVLGAVARAHQVVVVGDPLQLPPPLDGRGEREGDSEAGLLDHPTVAATLTYRLRWHDQSRHEGLIAFSNQTFYGQELFVVPAARPTSPPGGITHWWVREGSQVEDHNPLEGAAVIEAAIDHLLTSPDQSLGLIALHDAQREWMETHLTRRLAETPAAALAAATLQQRGQPVFVKSVEQVQGEVRDTILLSLTVARDARGEVRGASFGWLDHARDGHRYLNVMITRARHRMLVFSSILAHEIPLGPWTSRGVTALRDYLARIGSRCPVLLPPHLAHAPQRQLVTGIARLLQAHGYRVDRQLSRSGSPVDLALVQIEDPSVPPVAPSSAWGAHLVSPAGPRRSYSLGLELDGWSGGPAFSTRDRDRLRPLLLSRQGWPIDPLWSPDWFRRRDLELRRLLQRLEATRDEAAAASQAHPSVPESGR